MNNQEGNLASLLNLAGADDESNAKEILRNMPSSEWGKLQKACSQLDEWIDDLRIENHRANHRRAAPNER